MAYTGADVDNNSPSDRMAIGRGSTIAQLKRLQVPPVVQMALKPTWGTSRFRDNVTTANGGSVAETGGEIKVSAGTSANGSAIIETVERGQYRSGTWGHGSVGIRVPSPDGVTGEQVARWGYFDADNGFGWGVDATGVFTFRRKSGSDTVYRPPADAPSQDAEWNHDPMNGAGPSGLTLDISEGMVFHTVFRWYGHGPCAWYIEPKDTAAQWASEVVVDQRVYPDEVSLPDPNQPIRVEVDNGATSGSELDVYMGGRQFALWGGGGSAFQQRTTNAVFSDGTGLTIPNDDTWYPLLAVRRKSTFGPSGRTNSVRVVTREVEVASAGQLRMRVAFDATPTLNGLSWGAPDGVPTDETALETVVTNSNLDLEATGGIPIIQEPLSGSFFSPSHVEVQDRMPLGNATVATLDVKNDSAAGVDVTFAGLKLEEQW